MQTLSEPTYEQMSKSFPQWKKTGDLIDQCIDLMLNLRQSGHPGGSRSKVPIMVANSTTGTLIWRSGRWRVSRSISRSRQGGAGPR